MRQPVASYKTHNIKQILGTYGPGENLSKLRKKKPTDNLASTLLPVTQNNANTSKQNSIKTSWWKFMKG